MTYADELTSAMRWSQAEIQLLRERWPNTTATMIVPLVNRSLWSVRRKAQLLGLRKIEKITGSYRALAKCLDCGKERMVNFRNNEPVNPRCASCAAKGHLGPKHPNWKGGRALSHGYVRVYIDPRSSYAPMKDKNNLVGEHRLVMAQHLGRCLTATEVVHHKNGNKSDNRLANLELVSQYENVAYGRVCERCELKKEIRLLRLQVRELSRQLQLKWDEKSEL